MTKSKYVVVALWIVAAAPAMVAQGPAVPAARRQMACEALLDLPNVTVTRALSKPATAMAPAHCYMQGTIDGRIRFHMQLPLPENWNGRLLNIGDGGKDGDLDFADSRLAQGYAVANSNTGHDAGAEPRATFADHNLDSVIDFGHRAVHLTAVVSKTIVRAFYGRPAARTFFEGCSTGGRQGLMEAQRLFMFPRMGHCGGGPGCSEADPLEALVEWVEKGVAPDFLVARHRTDGVVDNERRICAWPQRAMYAGPANGQNDRQNWVQANFVCR